MATKNSGSTKLFTASSIQADYVLAPFTAQEQAALPEVIEKAGQVSEAFCTLGIARTMEQYN